MESEVLKLLSEQGKGSNLKRTQIIHTDSLLPKQKEKQKILHQDSKKGKTHAGKKKSKVTTLQISLLSLLLHSPFVRVHFYSFSFEFAF
jgi:hypothetical protein